MLYWVRLHQLLIKFAPQRFLIVMYHGIGENGQNNHIGLDVFKRHVEFFKKHFEIVPLGEILGFSQKKRLAITFDDGYDNNLAACGVGVPMTIFVTTESREFQSLSPWAISELSNYDNVEIGSHGATHRRFNKLSNHEIEAEVISSNNFLEHETGKKVRYFSYPHGAYDLRTTEYIEGHSQYEMACAVEPRFDRESKYELPRLGLYSNCSFYEHVLQIVRALWAR